MHDHGAVTDLCTSSAVRWMLAVAGVLALVLAARAYRRLPMGGKRWMRPIFLGVSASMAGEAVIWLVWGLLLYPEGDPWVKLIWTVVFCGLGMGSVAGGMVSMFLVERVEGWAGVATSSALAAVVLGLGCDLLCLNLDAHYFHYFGAEQDPGLFFVNGLVMSTLGGALVGWLCLTPTGRAWMEKRGL